MHLLIKNSLRLCLCLATTLAYAECERTPYTFQMPDEFIKHSPTQSTSPRGTVLISHGGTSDKAGPLSQEWAKFFNSNGFDAIVLNHYPQRGLSNKNCKATLYEAAIWRRDDSYAVLSWLNKTKTKASEKIVLAGFSAGSAAVFPFVTDTQFRADLPNAQNILAGIVFYPWANGCMNPPAPLLTKLLFVAASEDNVFNCWKSSPWLDKALQSDMTLSVVENAFHAFDNPSMKDRTCSTEGRYPYCMQYDKRARETSEAIVNEYLKSIGL